MLPKISLPANAYLSCSVCILSVCFKLQAVPTSLAYFMEQVNELSLTNDAWRCSPPHMPCSCQPALRLRGKLPCWSEPSACSVWMSVPFSFTLQIWSSCTAAAASNRLKYFKDNSKLSFPLEPLSRVFRWLQSLFKQGLNFPAALCCQLKLLTSGGVISEHFVLGFRVSGKCSVGPWQSTCPQAQRASACQSRCSHLCTCTKLVQVLNSL